MVKYNPNTTYTPINSSDYRSLASLLLLVGLWKGFVGVEPVGSLLGKNSESTEFKDLNSCKGLAKIPLDSLL